jgi:protein-disulfide isomerase
MPSGGFRMGNPKARVALIEYGAMTCPHCRRFDEAGVTPLISKYVKTGRVSFEFRNYLLNALDLPPSLIARCNGPRSFFPLTRALFKDQAAWVRKVQAVPKAQFDSLDNMPPEKAVVTVAGFAGLPQWAAARGVPRAKSSQCLTNMAEIDRLVQMTSDATKEFPDFTGTPTFIINGKMVDLGAIRENEVWPTLEKKLNEVL